MAYTCPKAAPRSTHSSSKLRIPGKVSLVITKVNNSRLYAASFSEYIALENKDRRVILGNNPKQT